MEVVCDPSSTTTISRLLVDEDHTCEHCNTAVAVIACTGCLLELGEPFYYCQSCCDMIHKGNKKCIHSLSQLINISELKNEVKGTVEFIDNVNKIDQESIEMIQQIIENTTTKSENMAAECRYLFNDIRTLLDTKEKELLSRCETVREMCLEVGRNETELLKNRMESSSQTKEQLVTLIETPPEELKDNIQLLSDKAKQVKEELTTPIVSSLLELVKELSFLPDTVNIKELLKNYCIPYHRDWSEGDTVPVGAPSPNIDTNGHFWLHEPPGPLVMNHLALISLSLTNMISSSKVCSSNKSYSCGDVCAVYFPQDQSWHRGLIEKVLPADKEGANRYIVRYMDYGNTQELYSDCIAALPPVLLSYPFQCRRCRFTEDTTSASWGLYREAKWRYSDLTNKENLTVIVNNKVGIPNCSYPLFTVQLFNDSCVDIGQEIMTVAKEMASKPKESYYMASRDIRYTVTNTVSTTTGNNKKKSFKEEERKEEINDSQSPSQDDGLLGPCPTETTPNTTPPTMTNTSNVSPDEIITESIHEENVSITKESEDLSTIRENDPKDKDEDSVLIEEVQSVSTVQESESISKDVSLEEKVTTVIDDIEQVEEYDTNDDSSSEVVTYTVKDNETDDSTSLIIIDDKISLQEKYQSTDLSRKDDTKTPPIVTLTEATPIKNIPLSIIDQTPPTSPLDIMSPLASSIYSSSPTTDHTHNSETSRPIDTEEESENEHSANNNKTLISSYYTKVSLPSDSDTPTDESKVAMTMSTEKTTPPKQVTPPITKDLPTSGNISKATPTLSSLPKLALDLGTDLTADVGGVVFGDSNGILHPSIEEGAKLSVTICTSLDTEGLFWCQLILDETESVLYNNLFDKLQKYAATKGQYTPGFFNPGDMCLAIFSEDSQWYRGLVESMEEEDSLRIRFIDYGNIENVQVPNTMSLKSQFRQLPYQSFQCSLANESKQTFTKEECERFEEFVQFSATATVVSISNDDQPVVTVNITVNIQEEEQGEKGDETEKDRNEDYDLFQYITSQTSPKKTRAYSFEMAPEEDNAEGLTWAERTERDLLTCSISTEVHSDSDIFLKPKKVTSGFATDVDDVWIEGETPPTTFEFKKPFKKPNEDNKKSNTVVKEVESKTLKHRPSSRPTSRPSFNTSGISKYLGHKDSKKSSEDDDKTQEYKEIEDGKGGEGGEGEGGKGGEGERGGEGGRGKGKGGTKRKGRGAKNIVFEKEVETLEDDKPLQGAVVFEVDRGRGRGKRKFGRKSSFEKDSPTTQPVTLLKRGETPPTSRNRTPSTSSNSSVGFHGNNKRTAQSPTCTKTSNKIETMSLFVRNIPLDYTTKKVAEGFHDYGTIYDVRKVVKYDRAMFFVDMEKLDALNARQGLDGIKVPGSSFPMMIRVDHNGGRLVDRQPPNSINYS